MPKFKIVYTHEVFEELTPILDSQRKSILKTYQSLLEDEFHTNDEKYHRKFGFELALASLGLEIVKKVDGEE